MQASDEAIFAFLVENSPDGHFILLDGQLVYLNRSAQQMFGVTVNAGDSIPVADVLAPDERERAQRNQALRINGVLRGATSYTAQRTDGTTFPIEVHAAPLKLRGRAGLHGVIRDISARKAMELQLEQMERAGVVSRLSAGIAHDFNNLLAVIQANTEVAQRDAEGPGVQNALKRIRAAVQRGSEKVRQIQQMGGGGRSGPSELRPLYVNPLVEDVLDLTRARWKDEADSLGVRYDVHWDPGLPPPIEAAEGDLRAALVALVFNAIEAMPSGGTIRIGTSQDAGGNCLITVKDEGEGIAADNLARLTDAFYTTRPDRQMGLGLHLVASVLERHGGHLEVDSRLGVGSTVAFLIPAGTLAPSEPPPAPRSDLLVRQVEPTVPDEDRPRTRGGRSVLIVDDQADLVQVVRTILEGRGYSVDTALNGRDGVGLARRNRYNVVLTDLGMPDISGWEVAQQVREVQPGTPVVLMTGWAADIDSDRLAENSIRALLPKPFRSEQLLTVLGQVLDAASD